MPSGTERGTAGLTAEGLDALVRAMLSITDEGMDLGIRDVIVRAPAVGTAEAVRSNPFGRAPAAFQFVPGAHGWAG